MDRNARILLIVAIFIAVLVLPKMINLFTVLPMGQYSAPPDCSFITNVNPYNSRAMDYGHSEVWIAVDINGDGIKEKFGEGYYSGELPCQNGCPGGIGECTNDGSQLITNYNSMGDDMTQLDNYYLWVQTSCGTYSLFRKDYGAAKNAITDCTNLNSSCTTFTQLQTYANQWISGTITFSQLITYANSWSSCS